MRIKWRRVGAGVLIVALVLVFAAGVWARLLWLEVLQNHGIEPLDWQGLTLTPTRISFDQLTVTQATSEHDLTVDASGLTLTLRWQGVKPKIATVAVRELSLDWQPVGKTTAALGQSEASSSALAARLPPHLPDWLPHTLNLQTFHAVLPCASGRCALDGAMSVTTADSGLPITVNLQLDHDGYQLELLAVLMGHWRDDLVLTAEVALDGHRHLSASSRYSHKPAEKKIHWGGAVEISHLPQADWLLDWLQAWQSVPLETLPAHPETGSVSVLWDLQGPEGESFLRAVSGTVLADAHVPKPWPAPGLGTVFGHASVSLLAEDGAWHPEALQADIQLNAPAAWVQALPEKFRPETLKLSLRPGKQLTNTRSEQKLLPLQLKLTSKGGADIELNSHFAASTSAPWRVQLGETLVSGELPNLTVADWSLNETKARVTLTGWADANAAELTIGKPTSVQIARLNSSAAADLKLNGVIAELAGAKLLAGYSTETAELSELSVKGPVTLTANKVHHPKLHSQSWRFSGNTRADLNRFKLDGVLKAAAGTSVNTDLVYPFKGALAFQGNARVSGESEMEALAKVLKGWPEALIVSGGNVSVSTTFTQTTDGTSDIAAKLAFSELSGVYDRTAWTGINGTVAVDINDEQFSVTVPELTATEVNAGIPFGPITLRGHYEAQQSALMTGRLTLEQAISGALGGHVEIKPDSWELADVPLTVPVEISRLSLAQLLIAYPTEGLTGTGVLSGAVPLLVDPATGIQIKRGRLDALRPGGRIQLSAERLRAFASGNEAMKVVAQALEDFRYSVLGSGINYDENGNLVLNLHLEGNNPELQGGHPVVLNINLEENIPALLTSLQLSGRVSDAVAERVKALLKKRERKPADLLE